MPLTNLNIGAAPNDGTGETLRSGGAKINTNYTFTVTTDTAQTITGAKTFSSPIGAADGAVGTPSVTFASDLNTGMWRPAADTVAFSTNGAHRMRIDSSGNVGIGTTNPGKLLDVSGDASINGLTVGRGAGNYSNNTVLGSNALSGNNAFNANFGEQNVAIGLGALKQNYFGYYNVAIGFEAAENRQNDAGAIAIGYQAYRGPPGGTGATSRSVAIGYRALASNQSNDIHIAIGREAMEFNVTNSNLNIAIGDKALRNLTTSGSNTAVGHNALENLTAGGGNCAVGVFALGNATTSTINIGLGAAAGGALTTGSNNILIGVQVAPTLSTGSGNVIIGNNFNPGNLSDTISVASGGTERFRVDSSGRMGVGIFTSLTNRLQLPNTANVNGRGLANAWSTYSDARIKSDVQTVSYGLETVKQLRPVKFFQHNTENDNEGNRAILEEGDYSIGLIAQDVLPLVPEVVDVPESEETGLYSVDYAKLVTVLIKAVQELSAKVEELEAKNV